MNQLPSFVFGGQFLEKKFNPILEKFGENMGQHNFGVEKNWFLSTTYNCKDFLVIDLLYSAFSNVSYVSEVFVLDWIAAYAQPTHLLFGTMKGTGNIFRST